MGISCFRFKLQAAYALGMIFVGRLIDNLFTLSSDLFPSRAVASVVGIGGMAGAVGGMLIAEIVGHVLQWTASYMIPFFIAASAYLIALLLIHLLTRNSYPTNGINVRLCTSMRFN
jgi:nitrate/nitrite transporter NarK